jgi:hypothetical protein
MVQHSISPPKSAVDCLQQVFPCFMVQENELGPFSRVLIEFESQRQGKHCLDSGFGPWMVVGLLPPWSDNRNILLWGSHFAPKLVGTRLHRIYTALILQHRASSSSDTEAEAIKWHYCERFAVLGGVRSTAIIFRLGFPPPYGTHKGWSNFCFFTTKFWLFTCKKWIFVFFLFLLLLKHNLEVKVVTWKLKS